MGARCGYLAFIGYRTDPTTTRAIRKSLGFLRVLVVDALGLEPRTR